MPEATPTEGPAALDIDALDPAELNWELELGGTTYVLCFGEVTARLVAELELIPRAIAPPWAKGEEVVVSLPDLLVRLLAEQTNLLDLAVIVYLARRLAGELVVDPGEVVDAVALSDGPPVIRFIGKVDGSDALDADPND